MVTGMLLLMSISGSAVERNVSKIGMEDGEYVNCWESANEFANAVYAETGDWDYADLCFDVAYSACTSTVYGL